MSLVTPEFGLLFWMVVIFGIVFFLLAKFGFPIISKSVEKRSEKIAKSLKDADEIEARMASWKVEQARMMEDVRRQQSAILKEAAETKNRIVADANSAASNSIVFMMMPVVIFICNPFLMPATLYKYVSKSFRWMQR